MQWRFKRFNKSVFKFDKWSMKEEGFVLGEKRPVTIPKALKIGFFSSRKSLALERLCLFYLNLWQFHSFCLRMNFDRDEGSRVRRQIIACYRNFQCFSFSASVELIAWRKPVRCKFHGAHEIHNLHRQTRSRERNCCSRCRRLFVSLSNGFSFDWWLILRANEWPCCE